MGRLIAVWATGLLVAGLFAVSPAQGVPDPDDTAGPLDIHRASAKGPRGKLHFTVRTREAWANDVLAAPGGNRVSIEFSRRRSGGPARCLDVKGTRPGEIASFLSRTCGPLPPPRARGTVKRTSDRAVRITVRRSALGRKARFWRATTSYGRFGDAACPAPEYAPPESPRAGSCVDATRWVRVPQRR